MGQTGVGERPMRPDPWHHVTALRHEDSRLQLRTTGLPVLMLCLACAGAPRKPPPSEPPVHERSKSPPQSDAPPASRRSVAPRHEPEVASTFEFPTEGYAAGSTHGRRYLSPANHLGDDSTHQHLTRVAAIGNGIVRYVRRGGLKGYGSAVAVEHRLPDDEVVVSIYGHLCNHEGHRIPVEVGDIVTKGTLLGYIGDDNENGHGPEHIHLGIRRGEYDGVVCGYVGPRRCTASHFYDPTEFISARLSPRGP